MLPEPLKNRIQQAYRQIQEAQSLTPRYGQRLMIAEIARALAEAPPAGEKAEAAGGAEEEAATGDAVAAGGTVVAAGDRGRESGGASAVPAPVCVVEAGTGTGKTLAYMLGTLPLAQHLGYKVVLATATVALQEQILYKDLPDILRHTDLDFTYTLAKGRGRYLCLSRLDVMLQDNASQQAMEELFGDVLETTDQGAGNRALYEEMLEAVSSGRWDGDRDAWEGIVSDADWRPVTVEPGQCAGQKCSHYSSCCFYRARDEVRKVDCVVANHDLVLVDLALGGGAILPEPEETIYIFDEAHHLPAKTNQHFACTTMLRGSLQWLSSCRKALIKMGGDPALAGQAAARHDTSSTVRQLSSLEEELGGVLPLFEQVAEQRAASAEGSLRHTFELGRIPEDMRELAGSLGQGFARLEAQLSDVTAELRRDMEGADNLAARQQAERWFPLIGGMASRAESTRRLWHHFSRQDPAGPAPWARWLTVIEQGQSGDPDIQLACSPVLAANTLQDTLWERCGGAVLTSATLSALGNFEVLAMRAGLPSHTVYHRISSPFNYQENARFVVPKMGCEPGDVAGHTAAMIRLLPQCIQQPEASLVLFSSRRQMNEVLDGLPAEWRDIVLCQDDYQKSQLIRFHRERVDRGEASVIFGLASFAEGVDLPGKYCEHVLIAKLPFAVPDDPIEGTLAQWLEQQGRNPFMTLSVPEAALRLVQASGRLLRSESDRGCITLFDERIVTRRYGRAILDSLPPFRREIFAS